MLAIYPLPHQRDIIVLFSDIVFGLSTLIYFPMGYLIQIVAWYSPFIFFTVSLILLLILIPKFMPPPLSEDSMEKRTWLLSVPDDESPVPSQRRRLSTAVEIVHEAQNLLFHDMNSFTIFVFLFVEGIWYLCWSTVYGILFAQWFHMTPDQIGLVTLLVGAAEICGVFAAVFGAKYPLTLTLTTHVCAAILSVVIVVQAYALPNSLKLGWMLFLVAFFIFADRIIFSMFVAFLLDKFKQARALAVNVAYTANRIGSAGGGYATPVVFAMFGFGAFSVMVAVSVVLAAMLNWVIWCKERPRNFDEHDFSLKQDIQME